MAQVTCSYTGQTETEIRMEGTASVMHTEANGKGNFFPPIYMLSASLGSCVLTMMSMIAAQFHQNIDGTVITVEPFTDDRELGVKEFVINIAFKPATPEELKKKYLEMVQACPVRKSLDKNIKFTISSN